MLVTLLVKTSISVALAGIIVSPPNVKQSETLLRYNGLLPTQEASRGFNRTSFEQLLVLDSDNIKSGADQSNTNEKAPAEKTNQEVSETEKTAPTEGLPLVGTDDGDKLSDPKELKVNASQLGLTSTPEEQKRAAKANREFTGKVRGSMCLSCLKTLRKDILAKDGVMTVDVKVIQRTKDGSEPEEKVIRIGPDDPPISQKELDRLQKEADAQVPREASLSVKYIESKLTAADLKRTIKSHDFKLSSFHDDKLIR